MLGKVLILSDCSAESKGQAICGEKSDLKPLCAVLLPRGCCPVLLPAVSWLTARMQALISAIEQIRLWESQEDLEGFADESHGAELPSEAEGPMLGSDVTCLVYLTALLATNCFLWEAGIAVCCRVGEVLCHLHWQEQKVHFWERWV